MPDKSFQQSFLISLALHGLILAFFIFKFIYFSKPIIDLSQAINISISDLTESNRLPEKVIAPSNPQPEVKKEVKPAEPPKKELIVKKELPKPDSINIAKAKQKSALDKLKKNSALEKIRQELKNDSIKKLQTSAKKNLRPPKPRIIAAGSNLSGLDRIHANTYLQQVDQIIKQFWALPQWLMNKPFKAQVLVKFNMQGQILSTQVISPSGNNSYDQYCLKAIQDAAPFPKVPDKLTEKFSVDGVVIGFPE